MDKVTGQCPQTTTFLKRKESRSGIKLRSFRLPTLRLTAGPNRLTEYCYDKLLTLLWLCPEHFYSLLEPLAIFVLRETWAVDGMLKSSCPSLAGNEYHNFSFCLLSRYRNGFLGIPIQSPNFFMLQSTAEVEVVRFDWWCPVHGVRHHCGHPGGRDGERLCWMVTGACEQSLHLTANQGHGVSSQH